MRITLDHNTVNGKLMMASDVVAAVQSGIDNPSDAIIPADSSLYRVAHKMRFNRHSNSYEPNPPDAAFMSPWWSTYYDFNASIWASDYGDMSNTARATFAIHPAWRSDCSNYASIRTRTDLSVWYGLGKTVDLVDPATGQMLSAHPSNDVLQIYIPGFAANHAKWAMFAKVMVFEKNVTNGAGFQGNMPLGLRPGSV